MSAEKSSPAVPSHIINRSARQWVFGEFIVPSGNPTARIVEVPSRLHSRGSDPANHEADDAKDAKFKKILVAHLEDPNTGLGFLPKDTKAPASGATQDQGAEVETLRAQVAKLQRLVEAGDAGSLAKELEAAARELQGQLEEVQKTADAANARANELANEVILKSNELATTYSRIDELETQLKAAQSGKKKS